jgi:hypothetical protein
VLRETADREVFDDPEGRRIDDVDGVAARVRNVDERARKASRAGEVARAVGRVEQAGARSSRARGVSIDALAERPRGPRKRLELSENPLPHTLENADASDIHPIGVGLKTD